MKTEKKMNRSSEFLLCKNSVKSLKGEVVKGFTLVELVIVIAIVIVLSVVSVPIYRSYVDKAKWSEAYALLGTLLSASKAYYSEYGVFLTQTTGGHWTSNNVLLGVDARGNKYFTWFSFANQGINNKFRFTVGVLIPEDLVKDVGKNILALGYNITKGTKFVEQSAFADITV